MHVAIADVAALRAPGHPARPRGARCAATRSTSPTGSCRCCRSRSPTTCAPCGRARTAPAWPCAWCSTRTATRRGHTFLRALMRSAAKLAYEEAQAAIDGAPDDKAEPLLEQRAQAAVGRLCRAGGMPATAREPLDLDCRSARSSSTRTAGSRASSSPERLEAHRLIEEFMIQANVAAAETLEAQARARDLPGARRALEGEARWRCASSCEAWSSSCPGAGTLRAGDFNRCCSAPRRCPSPTSSTRWCCAPRCRRSMRPRTSATSA